MGYRLTGISGNFLRPIYFLIAIAVVLVDAWGGAVAGPAGSVIDVIGEVTVSRNAVKSKAGLFDNLFAGDMIQVAGGGKLVVTHNAMKTEYSFAGPGEFEMATDDIKVRAGAKPKGKNLAELAVASLGPESGKGRATVGAVKMRGAAPPITVPAEGETVLTRTPDLSWPGMPGVSSYQLTLSKDGTTPVLDTRSDQTRLKVDAAAGLEWGGQYQWFVRSASDEGSTTIVRNFKVVDRADAESLERLKPAADGEFSEWVLYARALQHVGAHTDARAVWASLYKMRPDLPALEALAKAK